MNNLTFVTGNHNKAENLSHYLGFNVSHTSLELDEIQSLDLKEVVEHKALQAFGLIKSPVLIEDTALEFTAFNRLPGTFIKFFLHELGAEKVCRLVDGMDRSATARSMFGYYDGTTLKTFGGSLDGTVAQHPSGDNGYDWDVVFIEKGKTLTLAAASKEDYERTYATIKPFKKLETFLATIS